MTSQTIRQTPWFSSQKWFTDIHLDKNILQQVSATHPVLKDIIDKLEKDDTALINDDADWASYLRRIVGFPSNALDSNRTYVTASVSRAIKTLLAYRALDIACYVLGLAPERKQPVSSPLSLTKENNTAVARPDISNWAHDVLEMEKLLEAHWAQPSAAASSSSSSNTFPLSTSTEPITSASNSTKEQIIRSMKQNIDLSNYGRRTERVHRFLASFHEVSAVMGYIISHGTTHLPNHPPELVAYCGKPSSNDVTLSYILSASSSPIMLFTKYNPTMKDPEKYLEFWSSSSFDDSFRVVDKALWTCIIHVMMGDLDAKAALRRFFNDSRENLNVLLLPNSKNKRKLPTDDISKGHEAIEGQTSSAVSPAPKRRKRYPAPLDFSHQATESQSLTTPSLVLGQGAHHDGHGASTTSVMPVTEPQDPPRTSHPPNAPNAPDPPMPTNALNVSGTSTITEDDPMAQDPPTMTATPMSEHASATDQHEPTFVQDDRLPVVDTSLTMTQGDPMAQDAPNTNATPAENVPGTDLHQATSVKGRLEDVDDPAADKEQSSSPISLIPSTTTISGTPSPTTHSTSEADSLHSPSMLPHVTALTSNPVAVPSPTTFDSHGTTSKNKDPSAARTAPSSSTSAPKPTNSSSNAQMAATIKKDTAKTMTNPFKVTLTSTSNKQTFPSATKKTGSGPTTSAKSMSTQGRHNPPVASSSKTTSNKQTHPSISTPATRNNTGTRSETAATRSQQSPVKTATRQPVASSSSRPSASKSNEAPLKANYKIKKEEDRLNGVLAQKSAARVIYWDLTSELGDWPRIEEVDAVESHNVVFASESVSYPITGSETTHRYQCAGHSADPTTWFKNLYERSDVIKATPKANQSVALYEKQAFRDLDCPRLQSHFRSHHIIVTDQSYLAPKFDKAALVDILKSESKPFRFIDSSQPEKANTFKKLKDLLDQVQSDDGSLKKSGRIYTILKTPTVDGPHPDSRIATDIQAFHATVDRPLCHNRTFPLAGNQWATVSTPHAVQHFHDGGLGTFIYLEIGYLFLFIAKSDGDDTFPLQREPFDQHTFEVVLLAPGSTIYLRPGTVYSSVSSTACAIRGGHFISTSTLRMTALGILQNFDPFSNHTTSCLDMILHIVTMFHAHWVLKDREEHLAAHLPDYATFEGIIDLFHIFVIADMGAILYAPRYGDNVVNYSDRHRKSFIQCRALAHQILKYLQSSHLLKSASNQLVKMSAVYLSFLVEQVQSFWLQQTKIQPSPNKPDHVDAVAVAIARCFHGKEQFWKCWARFDHLKNPPSPRYGFHGKPYAVAPPIHCMQVGSYFTKQLFDPEGKTPLEEEEEDDDKVAPEIRLRIATIKEWAKTRQA